MAVINIMSETDLRNVISHIEQNDMVDKRIKLESVIKMFPFYDLASVDYLQKQNICLVTKILTHFVENHLFVHDYNSLSCSVSFVQNQLTFVIKDGNADIECINALLELLLQLLTRFRNLTGHRVNTENICGLITAVLSSHYARRKEIWKLCCELFIHTLNMHSLEYQDINVYIKCVSNLLMIPELDMLLSYQIINTIFRARSISMIPEIETVYLYIEMSIKNVNKSMDPITIKEFILAISHTFTVCKYVEILDRISNELLKKFDIITYLCSNKDVFSAVVDILYNLVVRAFSSTPWMGNNLKEELLYLATCTNWDIVRCDVVFLTYYIDFVYLELTHDSEYISKNIIERLYINIPKNLPVIKAIYLLYPLYVIPYKNYAMNDFEHTLLRSLQHSPDLSNLLTFHVSQLVWILSRGSSVLKMDVMNVWLEKYDDDQWILKCIKKCKASSILISIILNSFESKNKHRAASLLSKLEDPDISKILLDSIPKALCDISVLQYILAAKPAMPDVERSIIIAQQVSEVLSKIQEGNVIKHIIQYSITLLLHFKEVPGVLKSYLNISIVNTLVAAATSTNDDLAISAMLFLVYLLKNQDRHKIQLTINMRVAHDLGVLFYQTSHTRIKKGFKLLHTIFKINEIGPVLYLRRPAIGLLQSLLCQRNGEHGAKAYTGLVRLFRHDECLCDCIDNYICVRIECRKPALSQAEFLVYLHTWLKVETRRGFSRIPEDIISTFLGKLDGKYKQQALDISNILNKWQRRATTTIDI